MISLKEILMNRVEFKDLPKEHQDNLMTLLDRINRIRTAYGKPMTVTSGYRSREDHIRIYKDIANKKSKKFDENNIPWGSCHLKGAAVDIKDSNGDLDNWCINNEKILEDAGLWIEHSDDTPGWTHFQIFPPKSRKRFFHP